MNDQINSDFFPPPKSISDHGRPSIKKPERLELINQSKKEAAVSFCRGFSLAASPNGFQSIIGRSGLPLILMHASIPKDGYRISIRSGNISVEASTAASFQYAGTTLGQLLEKYPDLIPEHTIEDEPSFPVRGVMLDISRCKVPTMATLFEWIDLLARWKINHLQLYTEHTFAYSKHKEVWKGSSPLTAQEICELDDYCGMLNIELVPNQNSFGHLERWLKHPDYIHLAEAPGGYETPWGEKRAGPFSLNPLLPANLEFLSGLYDELLPNFESGLFNIGGDETFDLGQGASKEACDKEGRGRVYVDFLKKIKHLVEQRGHTMLFWGDIVLNHPELVSELGSGIIALVWGYEADHPFEEQCAVFSKSGIPFWVCPGTSTWNSITGRLDNALINMDSAARAGLENGASGILITEWGDNGHWQTMPFSKVALAAGAFTAWHGKAPEKEQLRTLFSGADAAIELGNLYLKAGFSKHNTSPIFPLLRFKDPKDTLAAWSTGNLIKCISRANEIIETIPAKKRDATRSASAYDELKLGASMLRHALLRGLWLKNRKPPKDTHSLAEDMHQIRKDFSRLWRARNRKGGLAESIQPMEERLREYEDADQHSTARV